MRKLTKQILSGNWLPNQQPDYFLTDIYETATLYGPHTTIHVGYKAEYDLPTFEYLYGSSILPKEMFTGKKVIFGIEVPTLTKRQRVVVKQATPGRVPVLHFIKKAR